MYLELTRPNYFNAYRLSPTIAEPKDDIEINVAGYEKDELEAIVEGKFLVVRGGKENQILEEKKYIGSKKVESISYKAGMLTVKLKDDSEVIEIK